VLPGVVLTLLKFGLLLALYLFLARALRVVTADLYGPRRQKSPARPQVARPAEPPRKSRKQPREIVVHGASGAPVVRPLGKRAVTIGRAAHVDVVIDDVYASDEHAQILPDDDEGWTVRDLGSTNGTFLNDGKLTRPTPLAAGDQLRLGKTRIEVRR
jgi:pSer/pThr/pTyr-binding forkhead associated (FHA) protein